MFDNFKKQMDQLFKNNKNLVHNRSIWLLEPTNIIKFYVREEPYGFLSNFWRQIQIVQGNYLVNDSNVPHLSIHEYPTNEHFYQSCKAKRPEVADWIRQAPTATIAMKAGRSLPEKEVREDWEKVKVSIMKMGLEAKFKNENLAIMLLWTGDSVLIENSPTDMFWGGSLPGSKNMLGQLLMEVRDKIQKNRNSDSRL